MTTDPTQRVQHSDDTMPGLRMYILVRDTMPLGIAAVSISHAALACYLDFEDRQDMQDWRAHSFRNVVCLVTDEEFEAAKTVPLHTVISESNFGDTEVALAFCPRPLKQWPRAFRQFRLYDSFECGQCVSYTYDNRAGVIIAIAANRCLVDFDQPNPAKVVRDERGGEWVPMRDLRHLPPPSPARSTP